MMSKKYVKIRVAGYLPRSAKVAAMSPTGLGQPDRTLELP